MTHCAKNAHSHNDVHYNYAGFSQIRSQIIMLHQEQIFANFTIILNWSIESRVVPLLVMSCVYCSFVLPIITLSHALSVCLSSLPYKSTAWFVCSQISLHCMKVEPKNILQYVQLYVLYWFVVYVHAFFIHLLDSAGTGWVGRPKQASRNIRKQSNMSRKPCITFKSSTRHVAFVCTCGLTCKNEFIALIILARISETARWKNFVPVSYCRATQELLNGAWIMGIHPGEPKRTTFCARHFLWALESSMHKSGRRGAHECLRVMGLERAESRRVALSSGLCLES